MIMSVSEHLTAAYTSKESSIQTLSTTLVEGAANGAKAPTNTDRRMNALPNSVAGGRTTQPPSRAKSAVPTSLMTNRASEEEQFMGTDLPAPSGGHHRTSLVVNRGDMSMADISQMRLEGCRTRRLSPGSSCCGSVGEGTPSSMPPAPLRRCVSNASSPQVDRQDAVSSTLAAAAGMERSVRRRSTGLSTGANALDTSVAILQHMAYDTAARVEATHGGQTPTELLAVSEAANDSAPLSVATVPRQVVPETPLPGGDGREDATGPIGMFSTSDTAHSLSQMRTGGTRPYSPSSASSNSPLHSLSESELCGAHVHPLGASRNVSAQALSQLADQAVDVPDAAGRGGSDCGVPPGAARFGDSPDGARRRLRLVGAAAAAHGGEGSGSEVARAAAAAAPFCSPPVLADEVPRTIDATVYNHDFQRIISLEVKEALTRNMRPSVDDDEDEDEATLDYVLSGKVSPALLPMPTRGSVQMNDSRFCAFAPFQLPMAATSVGRLDSIVGSPGIDSNTKAASGFSSRPAARQPLSLSTAALEGDALACSGATTTTSSRGSKGRNPRTVSAQAWRFPALGYESPVISPAARRASQEEENEADAEERDSAAAATNTTGNAAGAAGSSRHTQRTAQPASCNSSSDHPPGLPSPLSNSWRHRRGSDTSSAAHARSRPASGNDPALGGPAGHDSTAPSGTGAHESSGRHAETTTQQQSAGVASMVRYEDGRRFTQPQVSTHSSSSLPGSGQVLEDSYPRKLEMMHTVYERLVQHRRNAPTPKAVKALVARKVSQGALDNFPTTPQTGQFAQERSSGSAVAVAAGTAPSSAVSSHARRSLSLSCSGALGRSAGYYSFGTRVSLSHPNRQALPQQYLGSCSNLMHGNPSPGATMLGSPAVSSLVAASANGCNSSGVPAAAPLNPSALEGFFTPATSPAARVARRSLNSVLLRRIESRPLLQSTLFLKHTLHAIREEHGDLPYPSDTSKGSVTMSQLALSGATAVPSGQRDASTANPATCVSGSDFLASAASPASEDADLSSHNTRGPSAGSSRSSVIDKAAAGNRKGDASGEMAGEAAQVHADPTVLDNTARAAERSAPQLQHEQPSTGAAAQVYTPSRTEDAGTTAQRYYRALTEAEQRVRHVHGVDGLEREVDNESMDLIVYVGMRLMGWLEVVSLLGCGSFGQVFLCKDLRICDGHFVHPSELGGEDYEYWNCSHAFLPFSSVDIAPTNPPLVAVKVVKSVPLLEQQSVLEAEMLVLIGAQTAPAAASATSECSTGAPPPEDPRCASVAKVLADGICYGHHCIIMERYGANLYEYIASNEHLGLPMYQIRSIGAQLFTALSLIHDECHIIHADIKPENMLLTLNSSRGVVRTNEAAAAATATTTTTAPDAVAVLATAPATTTTRSPAARDSVSDAMPPRRLPRCEDSMMTTCSPERSYITLRAGPTAAGRHRHGQLSRRSSAVPLEASTSMMGRSRGQSFFHLRSSATSRMTVVEQTTVPAPEPRRVQSLNQSAGMLSSRHPSTSPPDASRAAADGAAGPNASALTTNVSGKAAATAVVSPPSMIPRLHVKLIDFSSSCYDGGPFYQYIQSRYYRAPEVVVGATYGSGIDMWSSGCLLAELLLGMPLLPGCNDHHQLCLIEEMVGPLPTPMLEEGVNMELYYRHVQPENVGAAAAATTPTPSTQPAAAAATAPPTPPPRPFALRTREEFLEITQSEPQPYRRYFTYQTLQELVRHCPLTLEERRMSNGLQPYVPANESSEIPPDATPSPSVRSEMMKQRFLLFDLLRRLLQTDATQRPTASQALAHPFFTSAPPYMKTFKLD